jgi:hypothetical protein
VPPQSNQKRITFLVNIWLNKCPVQSRPFPEKYMKDFDKSIDVSGCFQFAKQSDRRPHQQGAAGTFAKAPVPTIWLKDQLRVEGATLDLHRWSFVDGGVNYSTAIPLPTADKMKALSQKSDAFVLAYRGSGVEARINTVQPVDGVDGASEDADGAPGPRRKRQFWRPAHVLGFYS